LAGHWEKHAIQRCQITEITETRLGLMGYVGEEGGDTKKQTKKLTDLFRII